MNQKHLKDPLNKECIENGLNPFFNLILVDSTTSTNDWMKENAEKLDAGTVLISNYQSQGKGRNQRSFYSPKDSGIYLSILLKPDMEFDQILKLTSCTSVAIYDAIKKSTGINSQIKWVNDILIDYKKVAGILCEGIFSNNQQSIIIGVGMNVHSHPFPDELKDIAGCIEDFSNQQVTRNELIKDFLNHFYYYYQHLQTNDFMDTYRNASCILGKDIQVHEGTQVYSAHALSINDQGHLIVKVNGKTRELSSGEITIRQA